ncbi:3-hydroxyisobutyryl-Coenzyme A hydrolase [Arthroderma uncinatum]|uniref:3-hydroxyisobutyryl-Coenzyme A hydrolase n=1 Tax=Arthroderma uncinatum TaxID=74035 RepID=UPI00144AF1B3|nr:3-hydroxyisobutyryl-Coenzyme A hydrolase [Arthroderma uncinatum]KAF3483415.1 3-hydroxyisobutyryl-Coenzyme A hydrolase [Arthroderma uncinatum]
MPLRAKVESSAFSGKMRMLSSAAAPKEFPDDDPDDVLFSSLHGVRLIELNRPKKLNSLNGSMVRKILPRLQEWQNSHLANVVMIAGAGTKAFCAGGDVAELAQQNTQGVSGQKKSREFFGQEYQLDHYIATYRKPFVAILDGITMGGGVGLSVHAPFRIATERTMFAMPETTIGFFPDVGGSFFLPRLDGEIGTYLALTSERLSGVQAFYAGIATHYLPSSALGSLTSRLSELVFRDMAPLKRRLDLIEQTISEYTITLPTLKEEPMLLAGSLRESIDRCFAPSTVEEIVSALQEETVNPEWAAKTLKTISQRSPIALKVTLRQLRLGKNWTISEAFQREDQIAGHFMAHPDFVEGVSARLVNKPPTKPVWKHGSLAEVTDEDVDAFFRIPEGETRLPLLSQDGDYKEYPYAKFALPRERDITDYVRQRQPTQAQVVVEGIMEMWEEKLGVKEKVIEVLKRKTKETEEGLVLVE